MILNLHGGPTSLILTLASCAHCAHRAGRLPERMGIQRAPSSLRHRLEENGSAHGRTPAHDHALARPSDGGRVRAGALRGRCRTGGCRAEAREGCGSRLALISRSTQPPCFRPSSGPPRTSHALQTLCPRITVCRLSSPRVLTRSGCWNRCGPGPGETISTGPI